MPSLVKRLMTFDHTYRFSDSRSTYNHWSSMEIELREQISSIDDETTRKLYTDALTGNVEPLILIYGTLSEDTFRRNQMSLEERFDDVAGYHRFISFLNDLAIIMIRYPVVKGGVIYSVEAPHPRQIENKVMVPNAQQLELNALLDRTDFDEFKKVKNFRFKLKLPSTTANLSEYNRFGKLTHFVFRSANNELIADFKFFI